MPGPARAGALLYAKDLERLSGFYRDLLDMKLLVADREHHVLESADIQLILHAIPPHLAESVVVSTPPVPREDQAIKLFFTVPSLSAAAAQLEAAGGALFGPRYDGPGFVVSNAFDPEGNIFHLRAQSS